MLTARRCAERLSEYGLTTIEILVPENAVLRQSELREDGFVCTGFWTGSDEPSESYLLFEWIPDELTRKRAVARFQREAAT